MMSAPAQRISIGRGRGCGLLLTHCSVSRQHAELVLEPGGIMEIRDLQSTGGTYVLRDGKEIPVTQMRLRPNDTLRFGEYEIALKELLYLVQQTQPREEPSVPVQGIKSPEGGSRPNFKTRMMRCTCGSIKERGKPCPDCGA